MSVSTMPTPLNDWERASLPADLEVAFQVAQELWPNPDSVPPIAIRHKIDTLVNVIRAAKTFAVNERL